MSGVYGGDPQFPHPQLYSVESFSKDHYDTTIGGCDVGWLCASIKELCYGYGRRHR